MNYESSRRSHEQFPSQDRPKLFKLAASLVVDYFRWTQLTPMITLWLFAGFMLAAMFFINNEELTFNTIEGIAEWVSELPWIGEIYTARLEEMSDEDGRFSLGGAEFEALAVKIWSALSLIFMALAQIGGWLFGSSEPWRLHRKLTAAAIACILLLAGFIAVYFADSELFNGSIWQWMLMFTAVTMLVFIVNAWCLSVAHLLGFLSRMIMKM